jgi:hypothetical protein
MFRSGTIIEKLQKLKNEEYFNNIRVEKENFSESDGRCLIILPYFELLGIIFESKKFNFVERFTIYRKPFDRIFNSNGDEFYVQFY